jgi:DNA-binding transcriptional LysR family regulator
MNFTQLEYFLCICHQKSITKAAEQLFLSQSALSQQLIRLEKELGTVLFYRHGLTLSLTDAGEKFQISAQKMLFEYRNTQCMIEDIKKNGGGRLSVAVTKTKSFITLSYLLSGFKQRYPNIDIRIFEVDSFKVEELIIEGTADLGFCYGTNDLPLQYENIYEEQILLAIPPTHALTLRLNQEDGQYPSISFDQFKNEPIILGKSGYLRTFTMDLFARKNQKMSVAVETDNPGLAHLLVAANIGCSFIGKISTWIEPLHIAPPVYCVMEGEGSCFQQVCIGYHKGRFITCPMRLFIDYAKKTLNAFPF